MELHSEPSLFVHDEAYLTSLSSPELTHYPLWKRHQDDALFELVAIEEQSLQIVLSQLYQLKAWLLKSADIIPSVIKRIEMIGPWRSCSLLVSSG